MGMLSKLNPAGEATKNFNLVAGAPGKVMAFMREHPTMSKAVTSTIAIAFPPARAAIMALEMANKVSDVLEKVGLDRANKEWNASDAEGRPLTEKVDIFKKKASQSAQRHQMV